MFLNAGYQSENKNSIYTDTPHRAFLMSFPLSCKCHLQSTALWSFVPFSGGGWTPDLHGCCGRGSWGVQQLLRKNFEAGPLRIRKKSQNLWPRQQTLDPNFAGWIEVHGLFFKARISRKENPLVLIRAVSVHSATREEKWNHFAFQMLVSRVIPLTKTTYKVLGKSSCLLIAPSTWVHHTCHNSIKKGNHKTLSSL